MNRGINFKAVRYLTKTLCILIQNNFLLLSNMSFKVSSFAAANDMFYFSIKSRFTIFYAYVCTMRSSFKMCKMSKRSKGPETCACGIVCSEWFERYIWLYRRFLSAPCVAPISISTKIQLFGAIVIDNQ